MADELLSKIFCGAENGADPLNVVFAWFDEWEDGLCARAVKYVRDGDGRPVLAALSAARPAPMNPVSQFHSGHSKWMETSYEQTTRKMYIWIFIGFFGGKPEELARYVEVRSAALNIKPQRSEYTTWITDGTPDVVVNLIEFITDFTVRISGYKQPVPGAPDTVSLDDLFKAIELLGGTPADMISNIVPPGPRKDRDFRLKRKLVSKHLHSLPASDFIQSLERRRPRERAGVLQYLTDYPVVKDPAFLEFLMESATAGSAQVREAAQKLLEQQPDKAVTARAIPLLDARTARVRAAVVQVLGRIGSDVALDAMRKRAEREQSQDVLKAIDYFVANSTVQEPEAPEDHYVAADGRLIEIPGYVALVETEEAPIDVEDLNILKALDDQEHERRMVAYNHRLTLFRANKKRGWIKPPKPEPPQTGHELSVILTAPIDTSTNDDNIERIRMLKAKHQMHPRYLQSSISELAPRIPNLRLVHLVLVISGSAQSALSFVRDSFSEQLAHRIMNDQIDIRQVLHVARQAGISAGNTNLSTQTITADEVGFLTFELQGGYVVRSSAIGSKTWPITARHIAQVLLSLPPHTRKLVTNLVALQLLKQLPKLPMIAIDAVLYAALDERRRVHELAQAMLIDVEGIDERIVTALNDKRQLVRGKAARFLANRGATEAVPAIARRLKTEKSESARAEMYLAISRLGGDTSAYLGRAALVREAQMLVKKLPNAKIAWLQLETVPDLHWADGDEVEPVVKDAWLRLALKLKSPKESSLFRLYYKQLDTQSAMEFGDWVLASWIAYDTFKPAMSELREQAQTQAESYKATGQGRWARMSIDEIALYLLQQLSVAYPNSGIDVKGILALTHQATPGRAAAAISAYLKDHRKRVSQVNCLVEVLAAMGTREALQVLVATATSFRQRTVRQLAENCVATIAEERGWTEDELADRSIPTGGIEEDGVLALKVGEQARLYTARPGSDLSVKLFNPDGKEVKAIPAGKDENTQESRKLLNGAKKTIKSVVAQQSTRLYDAMVGARQWTLSAWEADVASHPIMVRLTERIIWRALAEDGSVVTLFRPTPEGDRLSADGDDADLSKAVTIDIAHTTTVDEDMRQAWLTHMDDFEVKPLFAQISRPMRVLDEKDAKLTVIRDREGWVTEAFKLRSATARVGYERGQLEGSAGFQGYVKTFRNAGVRAELTYSGSYLPAEDIPVAINGLQFFKTKQEPGTWRATPLDLSSVPATVLFEAWNDLYEIASVGAFDEDWQKKALYI